MIPKLIWQTNEPSAEDLKDFEKNSGNTWIFLNPSWKHSYADSAKRAEDIQNFDSELYNIYTTLSHEDQARLWGYVMVYQNGGFYTDMDSVCQKPLNDFLDEMYDKQDMVCTAIHESDGIEFVNNFSFAGIQNSVTIKNIIDDIKFGYKMLNDGDFTLDNFPVEFSCLGSFSSNIIENKNKILFDFDCQIQDSVYKTKFENYLVHYRNHYFPYLGFAEYEQWTIY